MSNIDISVPVFGDPTTRSVRDNFSVAKDEIAALQSTIGNYLPLAGGALSGPLLLSGAQPVSASEAVSQSWVRAQLGSTVNSLIYVGDYDAAADKILSSGQAGFTIGSPLPPANSSTSQRYFTVKTSSAAAIGNQPSAVPAGSWLISNGVVWIVYQMSAPGITAQTVPVNPRVANIPADSVYDALNYIGNNFAGKALANTFTQSQTILFAAIGSTVGSTATLFSARIPAPNTTGLHIIAYREAVGSWQQVSVRLQHMVDTTAMARITFNPNGNTSGVKIESNSAGGLLIRSDGTAIFDKSVSLAADPTSALQAVTKQYVDNNFFSKTAGGTIVGNTNVTGNFSASGDIFGKSFYVSPGADGFLLQHVSATRLLQFAGGVWFGVSDADLNTYQFMRAGALAATIGVDIRSYGSVIAQNAIYPSYGTDTAFYISQTGNYKFINWAVGWAIQWNATDGNTAWVSPSGQLMAIDGGGNLFVTGQITSSANLFSVSITISGNAYKPGGGAWAASSDYRVKKNVDDYARGLEDIIKLRPVSYKYNGAGGTVDDDKTYYGLIAQDTARIIPELVFEMPEQSPGAPGGQLNDQLALDSTPLTYAFINAFKTIESRLAALEAKGNA